MHMTDLFIHSSFYGHVGCFYLLLLQIMLTWTFVWTYAFNCLGNTPRNRIAESYGSSFHTVLGALKARILKWFAIPFSSGPHSLRPLHHDPPILGGPIRHGFHCVRQGCGPSVIRLTSFLWLCFQYVCPLMPSCNTYCFTWVSLILDLGYLFMATLAKRRHCFLPWMTSPLLRWTWSSSSTAPWMWGCSSWLLPRLWTWGFSYWHKWKFNQRRKEWES